jgi:hypothetical protein
MDLRTFIGAMTWRDWLAVIGFIVLPLSALNAFFGLRSRYLDWRGTSTKKKFEKRLRQLKVELANIEASKQNLPVFFLQVLASAMPAIGLCTAALALFMGAFAIFRIPLSGFRVLEFAYLGLGITSTVIAAGVWAKVYRLVKIVNNPKDFGLELLGFIYTGRQKGYVVGEEEFILSLMKNTKIFTDDERVQLFSRSFDLDRSSINDYGTKPVHRDNGA